MLVLGLLARHYLAGMDERFFRASLPGAEALVRYTIGDYTGAARAYRAHYATGYEPLPASGRSHPPRTRDLAPNQETSKGC